VIKIWWFGAATLRFPLWEYNSEDHVPTDNINSIHNYVVVAVNYVMMDCVYILFIEYVG